MNAAKLPTAKAAERAQVQRERILDAALACFVKRGFHAASMAEIADVAGMSPGLIYRYFDSKSAIILAIIERQLVENRTEVCKLQDAGDFAEALFASFSKWHNHSANPRVMNAGLFLDVAAEAARDPVIAGALHASDMVLREQFCRWLTRSVADGGMELPAEAAQLRAISLQCFMEGLTIRAICEPDLPPEVLKAAIVHFVDGLFVR